MSPVVTADSGRVAEVGSGPGAGDHGRINGKLYCLTRPAAGGVVAEGLGAIENALLDAKARTLGVPCYELLGGRVRDRIRLYWSHCATWRLNHPAYYGPPIHDLDGITAMGAEVQETGVSSLQSNIR